MTERRLYGKYPSSNMGPQFSVVNSHFLRVHRKNKTKCRIKNLLSKAARRVQMMGDNCNGARKRLTIPLPQGPNRRVSVPWSSNQRVLEALEPSRLGSHFRRPIQSVKSTMVYPTLFQSPPNVHQAAIPRPDSREHG